MLFSLSHQKSIFQLDTSKRPAFFDNRVWLILKLSPNTLHLEMIEQGDMKWFHNITNFSLISRVGPTGLAEEIGVPIFLICLWFNLNLTFRIK